MNLKEKGRKSKDKLMKAAGKCFAKYGFDATGIAEICRCAGMSKGAFYHHFTSKQSLLLELLNQWLEILDGYLDSARQDSGNILKLFMDIAKKAQPVFKEARGQMPIFLELWIKASRVQKLKDITIVSYRKYLKLFKEIIDNGIKEGLIREVNADAVSRMIVAVAVGFIMQGLLDPEGTDWDKVAGESAAVIIKGIADR